MTTVNATFLDGTNTMPYSLFRAFFSLPSFLHSHTLSLSPLSHHLLDAVDQLYMPCVNLTTALWKPFCCFCLSSSHANSNDPLHFQMRRRTGQPVGPATTTTTTAAAADQEECLWVLHKVCDVVVIASFWIRSFFCLCERIPPHSKLFH